MAGLVLTPEDRASFLTLMRRQINSAVHRRLNESTMAEHQALYAAHGRSGVEALAYAGRPAPLSAEQRAALTAWITATVPRTAAQACRSCARRSGRPTRRTPWPSSWAGSASSTRSPSACPPRPTPRSSVPFSLPRCSR